MIFSLGENCRPPREYPNKDRASPSLSSLPHSLNHRKPQKPSCSGSAADLEEPTRLALERLFYEYKVRKAAATAEGRTNLNTVENRRMNNCAAAAVRSWPGAASKAPPAEFCLWDLISHSCFIFASIWSDFLQQVSICLPVLCLWRPKKCTAVRRQWAFSSALWWARPFRVTYVNRGGLCCGRKLPGEGTSCHAIWLSDTWGEEGLQQPLRGDRQVWPRTGYQVVSTPHWNVNVWLNNGIRHVLPFSGREEFCEIFRAKDRNTLKMYTCKKFNKKDGRKVRKAAKNEIMILKM